MHHPPMLENGAIGNRFTNPGLKLLLLLESRLGHVNQVEGLACIIGRSTPVELERLAVRRTFFAHEDARKLVLRYLAPDPARWLRRLYAVDAAAVRCPDIIIGSGQATIAAGILLSRHFDVPFVFSGAIEGYDTRDVALQLVNSRGRAGAARTAYVPIPSLVDPDVLPVPRRLAVSSDLAGADIALLIGGTAYRRDYPPAEWEALERLVGESARQFGLRWRVSSSPRTPDEVADRFGAMYARGEIAAFLDFRTAGAGSARALFGADAIVVTADSTSMLAEGLAAKRPVVALKSSHVHKHYADEVIAAMASGPGLAVLPLDIVTAAQFAATLLSLDAPRHDARDLIALALAPIVNQALGVARARNGHS
ncbi:MAG TPA: ELM1/GtrOC1 family putative glycosyltransferase [Xanthobacteraceae bacterium]|nr:ELM1/GtrOC1 family putative glycosyltransferase [Xanthobacteraceae bacterium]